MNKGLDICFAPDWYKSNSTNQVPLCPLPGSVLNFSYKWNHTACDLLWLASFIHRNIFKVHSCCSLYQYFIPFYCELIFSCRASSVAQRLRIHLQWRTTGDAGSIPGWGRCPGGGHGNPLQYSYLENPMDRGAWWATVHRVAKGWTWLKWLGMHTCNILLQVYFTFKWSIHQLMGFGVVSTLWLLWIMLLQTFIYKFLYRHPCLQFSQVYTQD